MRKSVDMQKGFTLVELLTVMTIISILSVVVYFSTRQNRFQREMESFSSEALSAIKEARSRAISRNRRYAVWFTPDSVQWCEDDCPAQNPKESGKRFFATSYGARAKKFAEIADFNLSSMPAATDMLSKRIYFFPNGTLDADLNTAQPEGFTLYLQHDDKTSLKRRIVVLPLSGQIREFYNW